MSAINIFFPHQLFEDHPLHDNGLPIYLIEEYLFFKQYNFHKQKLAFHRASMQFYKDYLLSKNKIVHYIESIESISDIRLLIDELKPSSIHYINPTDDWLEKRISLTAQKNKVELIEYENPLFLNSRKDLAAFFKPAKTKFFQTEFYINERKKRQILVETNLQPIGGKWTFDAENRKKYPAKKLPPVILPLAETDYHKKAKKYVELNFAHNLGSLSSSPIYPTDFESSALWINDFLRTRFEDFGIYEDAILSKESFLHHSVLTPMLNVGLISPKQVIQKAIDFAQENDIPINSTEGFIRQIIGWREFIRGVYEAKGKEERTKNFWGFTRKIPASFYEGTTGIFPVDNVIRKVLETGYCHHIERLMVVGNFMVLCEFDPDEVYRWFMELFIDAFDWVMVPNVYGMSQFADGGLMATKPYISGSNYLMKMSDYPKGEWQQIWDALFWRFMDKHQSFFLKNPRLSMLCKMYDKMTDEKKRSIQSAAHTFLGSLDK